jgi:hypothetical protein
MAKNTTNKAVNFLAEFGRVGASVTLFLAIIIALIMLVYGIYLLVSEPETPNAAKERKIKGGLLVAGAFLIVGVAYLHRVLTRSSRAYAAFSGVGTMIDVFD